MGKPQPQRSRDRWSIWVDTGGTFTDCLALDPSGTLRRTKILSNGSLRGTIRRRIAPTEFELELPWSLPSGFLKGWSLGELGGERDRVRIAEHSGAPHRVELEAASNADEGSEIEVRSDEEAAVVAARIVTGTAPGRSLPPLEMRLATTRGTNALLELEGAEVALFVTRGFKDLLEIGNQRRPELFALRVVKPPPLYCGVVEVTGRLAADGSVLEPLDLENLRGRAEALLARGVRVAAIALLHSYVDPEQERAVTRFLLDLGFDHVSASAELAPLIRYLPRAETAVVDAYLAPVIGEYVEAVEGSLGDCDLKMMTSAGGLVPAGRFRPKDSLLSGPAGGVVGAAGAGRASGFERIIAFDMGGTSTDVSRFDGEFDYRFETRVGAAHLMSPTLAIETVAAGGGSVCGFESGKLTVGPASAGAFPGPACYGAGGPLSITDVNLLLGRLVPDRFEIPIRSDASRTRADAVLEALAFAGEPGLSLEELLEGFLRIANERMAEAVRRISVREGYDPAGYTLVAFGGAGGQHACRMASLLGMPRVLVPVDAGLLSALGLGYALVERFCEHQVLAPLADVEDRLESWLDELAAEAIAALGADGVDPGEVQVRLKRVHLRLAGQEAALAVSWGGNLRDDFDRAYRELYGYRPEDRPIEVESLRVAASTRASSDPVRTSDVGRRSTEPRSIEAFFDGRWEQVPVLEREALKVDEIVTGPALIAERHSATVVEAGWTARRDQMGALVLEPKETHE